MPYAFFGGRGRPIASVPDFAQFPRFSAYQFLMLDSPTDRPRPRSCPMSPNVTQSRIVRPIAPVPNVVQFRIVLPTPVQPQFSEFESAVLRLAQCALSYCERWRRGKAFGAMKQYTYSLCVIARRKAKHGYHG